MTITREQCLKWARESGFTVQRNEYVFNDMIEALCQRVWGEAQKAERAEVLDQLKVLADENGMVRLSQIRREKK